MRRNQSFDLIWEIQNNDSIICVQEACSSILDEGAMSLLSPFLDFLLNLHLMRGLGEGLPAQACGHQSPLQCSLPLALQRSCHEVHVQHAVGRTCPRSSSQQMWLPWEHMAEERQADGPALRCSTWRWGKNSSLNESAVVSLNPPKCYSGRYRKVNPSLWGRQCLPS